MQNKWDERFIQLAEHVATWSKDPSTVVAAVIVDDEHNVRALGYNGFPRGVEDATDRLNDRPLKYSMTVHAEANALATCSRLGIRTDGCTLVCTHFPCSTCCGLIIQAGIKRIVVKKPTEDFSSRWSDSNKIAASMLSEANIELVEIVEKDLQLMYDLIDAAALEASSDEWDGKGTFAVNGDCVKMAKEKAQEYLHLIKQDMPEVSVTPIGSVSFNWFGGSSNQLSMLMSAQSMGYAAYFGTDNRLSGQDIERFEWLFKTYLERLKR